MKYLDDDEGGLNIEGDEQEPQEPLPPAEEPDGNV
jgi:hypothetical protein